jgi:hypothetical protein
MSISVIRAVGLQCIRVSVKVTVFYAQTPEHD